MKIYTRGKYEKGDDIESLAGYLAVRLAIHESQADPLTAALWAWFEEHGGRRPTAEEERRDMLSALGEWFFERQASQEPGIGPVIEHILFSGYDVTAINREDSIHLRITRQIAGAIAGIDWIIDRGDLATIPTGGFLGIAERKLQLLKNAIERAENERH